MTEINVHKVAITAPVKNRRKILPHYLQCLMDLDFPKENLYFVFLDDCSDDGTWEYLLEWRYRFPHLNIDLIRQPTSVGENSSSRVTENRGELFCHLAYLRNYLIDWCKSHKFITHQFSVDTDILVKPNLLKHLLSTESPYMATIIFNDAHCNQKFWYPKNEEELLNRHVNFGVLVNNEETGDVGYGNFSYVLNHIYEGCITGACYLVNRKVIDSTARFGYHKVGEDIPYCLDLYELGLPPAVDTTPGKAIHVMDDVFLQEALIAFERW